jgi:hypothetical protein
MGTWSLCAWKVLVADSGSTAGGVGGAGVGAPWATALGRSRLQYLQNFGVFQKLSLLLRIREVLERGESIASTAERRSESDP